jgi:nicotinamide mononucleotide (NMN) deamidase PncC
MKSLSPEQLVEQIHDAPTRIVLAASGGGSRAIADVLEVPGASRTLLEAVVPYSAAAMTAWLGSLPDGLCSAATGRAMAMAAFHRARRYEAEEGSGVGGQGSGVRVPGSEISTSQISTSQISTSQISTSQISNLKSQIPVAGVACTASLASDRPKRGPHRIHVALQTASLTAAWHVQLQKDRRSRAEEERLAGRLLLNVVADACQLSERLSLDLLEGEQVEESRTQAPPAWQDLLLGKIETVRIGPAGESPQIVMPGAFNPLHDGHRRMMQVAKEMLGQPAIAEISILNVDKPPLDYTESERRLAQFPADQPVCLSRAATFEEKSRLFIGATFIVGVDTLRRIADPRYYGGDPSASQRAIEGMAARGCRFLVFGRDLGGGFVRLADLELPEALRAICREVPPEVFRADISSTEIRKSGER